MKTSKRTKTKKSETKKKTERNEKPAEYREITGRYQKNDVIAYQVRQSFLPGEITPEEANRIGYEFAERFTKGKFAFIVCTHIDKAHIHNHIIWNSTALSCTRKFLNFWGSTEAVRKLSDQICVEHQLSVVVNPQKRGLSYNKWSSPKDKLTNRDMLRLAIDLTLQSKPKTMDELFALLQQSGYEIKRGKDISLKLDGHKKFTRLSSIGGGYSYEELMAIIENNAPHDPFVKKKYPNLQQRAAFISALESKLNCGKGPRYDQAIKVIMLKQMAKTIVFLEENGYSDLSEIASAATNAEKQFHELRERIKKAESRLAELQTLKTHILNYIKTNDIWKEYKASGYSKKYYSAHEGEIILHKSAKKGVDELGVKKLPSLKEINQEFGMFLAEKKAAYAEYHKAKDSMRELMVHKANVEYMLNTDPAKERNKNLQHE